MPPPAIPKACKICRKLTTNKTGYCDVHEPAYLEHRAQIKANHELRRGSPSRRGYDATWVKVRKFYLVLHPMCEACEKAGRVTPATEVHHIVALRDGGERLDHENLMAVCRECHQRFTQEEIRKKFKRKEQER